MSGPRASRVLACGVALGVGALAPSIADARSPVYGPPYRRGIGLEVGLGPSICVPGGPGPGVCNPGVSDHQLPGFGLAIVGGWRINPWVFVGASYGRYGLTSGRDTSGAQPLGPMRTDGVYGVLRGIMPLRRVDLGLEVGLGWSRRRYGVDEAFGVSMIQSSGFALRPALVYHHWVLADFFVGAKVEGNFDLHTRFCSSTTCANNLGPVPEDLRDVFVHEIAVMFNLGGLFHVY